MEARTTAPTPAQLRKEFLNVLRDQLIPQAQKEGARRLILAEPPARVESEIVVSSYPLPPLRATGEDSNFFVLTGWSQHRMIASRFPIICFVLQGEMDLRVAALTPDSAAGPPHPAQLLTGLTAGTVYATPAGTPHDTQNHWWRSGRENANCDIFQMLALPDGARCHICTTRAGKHSQRGWLLAHDNQMLPLMELIMEELRTRAPRFEELVSAYLLAMLFRLERALSTQGTLISRDEVKLSLQTPRTPITKLATHLEIFESAEQYIQSNLSGELSVRALAAHVGVSPTYLNALFRKEAKTSVMRYVIQRRLEAALFYLENSSLPIAEIGSIVGYSDITQFSRAFRLHYLISPRAHRKQYSDSRIKSK